MHSSEVQTRPSPAISILVSLICCGCGGSGGCFRLCTAFPLASSVGGDTEAADEGGVVGDGDVEEASDVFDLRGRVVGASPASLTGCGGGGRGVVMGWRGGGTKPLHWPGSFRSMMLLPAEASADPAAEGRCAWKAATATEGARIGTGAGAERSMMLATLTSEADLPAAALIALAFFFFLTFFLVAAFLAALAPSSLHRGNSCDEDGGAIKRRRR